MKTFIIEATVCDVEMYRVYEANTVAEAYDMFVSDAIEGGGLEESNIEHYNISEGNTGDITALQVGEDDIYIIANDIERIRNYAESMFYYLEGEVIMNKDTLRRFARELTYISELADNASEYLERV